MQMKRYAMIFAFFATVVAPMGASAQDAAEEGLSVREIQLGTSLDGGLVTSPSTTFAQHDGRLYAVVRVNNPAREATTVQVAFERVDGRPRDGVSLEIPARRRYRTVARVGTNRPPGRYRCVVRTADGVEIGSVEFTIEG